MGNSPMKTSNLKSSAWRLLSLICAGTLLSSAQASQISISPVGNWNPKIVRQKTAVTEILGNPYAIVEHPERPRYYLPAIVVHRVTDVPSDFDRTSTLHWRVLLARQFPHVDLSDLQGRFFAGNQVRYYGETLAFNDNAQPAAFMGIAIEGEIYLFVFSAPRPFFLANLADARAFMQNTVVNPIQ